MLVGNNYDKDYCAFESMDLPTRTAIPGVSIDIDDTRKKNLKFAKDVIKTYEDAEKNFNPLNAIMFKEPALSKLRSVLEDYIGLVPEKRK